MLPYGLTHQPVVLGNPVMDRQHRVLYQILADLEESIATNRQRDVLCDIFDRLLSYMSMHFATEERFMIETDCPDLVEHSTEHSAALDGVYRLRSEYWQGGEGIPETVREFVGEWIEKHITGTDARLAEWLARTISRQP